MNAAPTAHLRLFGSPSVEGADGAPLSRRAAQRHRLALLALLALAPGRRLSRDKLVAYLWPESDAEHGRNLLKTATYVLRTALGKDVLLSVGDDLRLNTEVIRTDVAEFEEALGRADHAQAASLYRAPLLDGFFLQDAPEFEHWVERERGRLAGATAKALEELAASAEARGDLPAASEWWQARAAHDPYDSRVALRLMQVLEASGNGAAALQHAANHQRLLQEEVGTGPTPEVLALAERLRAEPPVVLESQRERSAPGTPPPGTPEMAPMPVAEGSPVPPSPATGRPAPLRRHSAARYGAVAIVLGAVLFGAPWPWRARSGVPPPAVPETSAATRPRADRGDRPAVMLPVATPAHRPHTQNVAAYEFYLRGKDQDLHRSESAARDNLEYLRQAVALDSTYAAAWARLGRVYLRLASAVPTPESERYYALAEQAARKAVALDDSLADGHAALGLHHIRFFDAAGAERHLERALELDPTLDLAHAWMVTVYLWTGRAAEALAHADHALELDPRSSVAHAQRALALLHNHRCDEALPHLAKLADLQPPFVRAALIQAQCHARKQMWAEAIAVLRPHASPDEPHALAQLGYMLARAGQRDEALRVQATLIERWRHGNVDPYQVAVVYVGLRDFDQAFALLERAFTDRARSGVPGRTLNHIILGPLFDDLRHDPRFSRLRARLGLQLR